MTHFSSIRSILIYFTLAIVLIVISYYATARDHLTLSMDTACVAYVPCPPDNCPSRNIGASCWYCTGSSPQSHCFGYEQDTDCIEFHDDDGCGPSKYGTCQGVGRVLVCTGVEGSDCFALVCDTIP